MIAYARSDTHYLLYCYDCLREDLIRKESAFQNLLQVVYCESALICLRVYRKPIFDKEGYRGLERRRINNRQDAAMRVLWHWRDRVAREEDESVQYVLPNHMLVTIAESLPREHQGILRCCNPVPPLVRECVHEIQKMIFKCRDLPLIECNNETIDDMYDELLRRRKTRGKYTKGNVLIICPLDFSQTEFDEELGNQLLLPTVDDSSAIIERSPTHTLLSVLDSAALIENDFTVDCDTYKVVDKFFSMSLYQNSTINKYTMNKIFKRLQSTGTPYESYTIATNQARKKVVEEKSDHGGDPLSSAIHQKLYTHHDVPVERHTTTSENLDANEGDIKVSDCVGSKYVPSFTDCQILTRRKMKQARRMVRSTYVDLKGPLYFYTTVKVSMFPLTCLRVKVHLKALNELKKWRRFRQGPNDCLPHNLIRKYLNLMNELCICYAMLGQSDASDSSFDPFNHKFRLENKKNFRHRPRGGHHKMTTMSIVIRLLMSTTCLRVMRCELGYLHRMDGSCSYSQGRTLIWASCLGPGDVHSARREDEHMRLDVSFRQLSGDCQYHELNNIIRTTLESVLDLKMFPRTGLTVLSINIGMIFLKMFRIYLDNFHELKVTAHVLQNDGSIGGAALTAVGLSILDSGISVKAPFCGVEVCQVDGKMILDANSKMQTKAEATWLFAFIRTCDDDAEVVASDSTGPFKMEAFASALSLARMGAKQIFSFYKEMIERKLSVDILPCTLQS
ncbi:HRDC domain protein [Dictyocaulus viviparus]|uniref:HRDC domain protein n=1 Tax=Dictyocaulus viviparus TaxID=29172 RepID=A0A0D8XIW7_DICVI|nr:HRDC domain protein [Dictyocaulus viviparus]